ncbi:MAG: rhodanese-like domain-containing protein [Desulfobulbaceae bacterium]|uniref:Rhodanese-like domain-containing protein n=1 Tax=Candidatus Desulfatifera sulfidica TaxID=2841691 RepID=A0A8J6N976_9BACT|nr:rhodanese-like domain-containing protein [Candidatus Desulfatifera sulfidica]
MKKTIITLSLALIFLFNVAALAQSFNFVSPPDFKQWLEADRPMIIVDIQEKKSFSKQHFRGSIETNAFPVKTDAEKKSLDPAVAQFKATGHDVIVVCPRGGGGAKRCYNYLKLQGVLEEKLFILQGGIDKWPHREMLISR